MASQQDGYWSRSHELITRDKGWIKPLLVLGAAQLVPIFGIFGADGYALEWGRLTAWGVDASPKQKGVDVWGCIKSGARSFVVALGYGLILALVNYLLRKVLGDGLGHLLALVLGVFAYVAVRTATLRATIYQRIGAGYQVDRIKDMIQRDHKGFLRVVGVYAVTGAIIAAFGSMLLGGVMMAKLGSIIPRLIELDRAATVDDWLVAETFLTAFADIFPILCVLTYVLMVAGAYQNLVVTTSTALWMRQFDVPNWGESSDPLPGTPQDAPAGQATEPTASREQASYVPTMQPVPQAQEVPTVIPGSIIQEPVDEQPMQAEPAPEAGSGEPTPTHEPVQPVEEAAASLEADLLEALRADAETRASMTDEERVETIKHAVDATFVPAEATRPAPVPEAVSVEPAPMSEIVEPEAEVVAESPDEQQAVASLDHLVEDEPFVLDEEPLAAEAVPAEAEVEAEAPVAPEPAAEPASAVPTFSLADAVLPEPVATPEVADVALPAEGEVIEVINLTDDQPDD